MLLLSYFISLSSPLLEISSPRIYLATNLIWFGLVSFSSISRLITRQDYAAITTINTLTDFIAIALLAYSCGGINSGLFFLMLPEAAMAGLMLPMRLSLLSVAVASISTLFIQTMLALENSDLANGFIPSGILGLMLFITTLVFGLLGRMLVAAQTRAAESARSATALRLMNESIIGIIASFALPQYNQRVIKTKRADGIQMLTRAMQSQERYFTNELTYTTNLTDLGYSLASGVDSTEGHYKISAVACGGGTIAQCVQLNAVPQGGQTGDGNLSLTSRGVKGGNWD